MQANPFTSFKVTPNYVLGHVLEWRIDPLFRDDEPHNFSVEVSGTMDFSVIEYVISVGNSFFILDTKQHKQNFAADTYYRVCLITGSNHVYYSKTITFLSRNDHTRRQYLIASEINRKELLRIKKYTGNPGWLLKRKAFGKPIQQINQVDPISGAPLTDNPTDFGVGIEGGYYNPLGLYFSTEDQKQERKISEFGVIDSYQATFRTIAFPTIDTYDIIVDIQTDDRWLVKDKQSTPLPSTELVLAQILSVQLIPYTDPTYKINTPTNEFFQSSI